MLANSRTVSLWWLRVATISSLSVIHKTVWRGEETPAMRIERRWTTRRTRSKELGLHLACRGNPATMGLGLPCVAKRLVTERWIAKVAQTPRRQLAAWRNGRRAMLRRRSARDLKLIRRPSSRCRALTVFRSLSQVFQERASAIRNEITRYRLPRWSP